MIKANLYADLLLKEDPYYSISFNDPERFAQLINNKKSGGATLVTASQQAETLEEAPVPVTLITDEMIKRVGAKNLKELLVIFVPGITSVESANELNVAMRGVYSSGQEKILIMLNGHRLNSYSTNSASPDYSISLNKIKQIEVLRGPASSLYGNVALTAVINIITKEGSDIDGINISYGMGNHGQYKADINFGKRFMGSDFAGWASFYRSSGQKVYEDKADGVGILPLSGDIILHGFNGKPSMDIGFKYKYNNFYAFYNYQNSKMTPSYSMSIFCAPYSYDNYRKFDGVSPGHNRSTHRGELGYSNSWDKFDFSINAYLDADDMSNYDVAGDLIPPIISFPIEGIDTLLYKTEGCYQIMNWQDYTFGASIKGSYNYKVKNSKGSLLVGAQFERYELYDNYTVIGSDFNKILLTYSKDNQALIIGDEYSTSAFAQIKQYIGENFIINAGLRYDNKIRRNREQINAVSPRISLIYNHKEWNMKLGYSRAFVDAPYFYRNNSLPTYSGASDLGPEYMNSLQYTFLYHILPKSLDYEANIYYNNMSDVVYNIPSSKDQAYINAGKLQTIGLEQTLTYKIKRFILNANLSYQYLIDSKNYPASKRRIYNIPEFFTTISAWGQIFSLQGGNHQMWLNGNVNFTTNQSTYINTMTNPYEEKLPLMATINLGISYNWKELSFSGNVYNVLNTKYYQGGTSIKPIRQTGTWFLFEISYKFK